MSYSTLDSFNYWIGTALRDIARLPDLPVKTFPASRGILVDMAIASVRHALRRANEMGCQARKSLCLRVLNWLRADMRRAA